MLVLVKILEKRFQVLQAGMIRMQFDLELAIGMMLEISNKFALCDRGKQHFKNNLLLDKFVMNLLNKAVLILHCHLFDGKKN